MGPLTANTDTPEPIFTIINGYGSEKLKECLTYDEGTPSVPYCRKKIKIKYYNKFSVNNIQKKN